MTRIDSWRMGVTKVRVASVVLFFLGFAPCAAWPEALDVTGAWDMKVQTQEGAAQVSLTLRQEGEKITGAYSGKMGQSRLVGVIKGDEIRFSVTLKFQETSYTVTYSGTATEDSMQGTANFGNAGSGSWSARRRKDRA